MITYDELPSKPLTDPEVAVTLKSYKEMVQETFHNSVVESTGGRPSVPWSDEAIAEELNVTQPTVSKAIKIATAIEKYPELAKERSGQRVLSQS